MRRLHAATDTAARRAVRAALPQNIRVVQPNLVYAVGLPLELCNEDVLRDHDYFGQFGKLLKVRKG